MSTEKERDIVLTEDLYEFKLRRFWIEGKRKKMSVPEHLESIRKKNMLRRTFVGIGLGILDKKADMKELIRVHDKRRKTLNVLNKTLSISLFMLTVFFVVFSSGIFSGKKKRSVPKLDVPYEKSASIKSFATCFADEYISKGDMGTFQYWEPGLPPQALMISRANLSQFDGMVVPRIGKVWCHKSENRIYYVTFSGMGRDTLKLRLRETGANIYTILSVEKS